MNGPSDSDERKAIDYQPKGKIDAVGVFYVVGGIPSMILFFLVLFGLVGACDGMNTYIPA